MPLHSESDFRITTTNHIAHELDQEAFVSHSKDGPAGVFSRNRKLTFRRLLFLIMSFKSSIQRDMDRFFRELFREDFNIREVTKGALTQARAKLNPWAFQRLNEVAVNSFYSSADFLTWDGYRLLAVDGSGLKLPNHPSIRAEFGTHDFGPKADATGSVARVSMLYDVLNQVALDAQLSAFTTSERKMLRDQMPLLSQGDLLLLDRGYPAYWLFALLKAKKVEFCMRLNENWWVSVKEFLASGKSEQLLEYAIPKKDHDKLAEYPEWVEKGKTVSVRLLRIDLGEGRTEVLATSLTNPAYQPEHFKELYHLRWAEEEAFKLLKARVNLEAFSGKTAKAVKQDFYAKVFMLTMVAIYAYPIEEKVRAEYKADQDRKYDQKINRTYALATFRDLIIPLFLRRKHQKSIDAFDEIVSRTREVVRPGRSNPRDKRTRRVFHQNYKPL